MTPGRTATRAAAAAIAVATLLALGACGGGNPDKGRGDITSYAALGDSFTSGVGLVPVTDTVCSRSSSNYPTLLATRLDVATFKDVSCAGASSDNLFSAQTTPTGTNAPQLAAVPKDADLVTIGLGLNDQGLSVRLLYPCLEVDGKVGAACDLYLQAPDSVFDTAIDTMAGAVKADLDDLRERAPDARIVLVGYPRILPDDATCPDQVPVSEAAAVRMRYAMKKVNEAMAGAARKARVDYVDMYTPSAGHDACSGADRWVNGQHVEPGKAQVYHPFAAYHEAVAAELETLLAKK